MLPHLIRREFPDREWAAADLDAAAEFWLRLYEAAAPAYRFSTRLSHEVEIRLRGFPRGRADALRDELARRVARSGFPAPAVGRHDPDTLVLASGLYRGNESPPAGLGLPLVAGAPFDGLVVEIRLRVVGNELRSFRAGTVRATLVLVGELRAGELLLKAVWRSGASGWEDDICWKTVWSVQDEWLEALRRFRANDRVPDGLARKVFVPRRADRVGDLVNRLIRVPRGKPRLAGLLARVLIFAALLAGLGLWAAEAIDQRRWPWLLLIGTLAYWVVWVASVFARTEARTLFSGYARFHAGYKRICQEETMLVPVPRPDADSRVDHPWGRKYLADLEAAGFTHAGDVRPEPPVSGADLIRTFLAPDGVTYLNVLFVMATRPGPTGGFQLWPATLSFLAHTYFPGGGRVTSINSRHSGFRRKRSGPESLVRLFPGAQDPVEFVRCHATAVDEFMKETGQSPLRHERFDWYVRRMNDDHEEQRRLYADRPYTWGDHLRWYLQKPRREYLGPQSCDGAGAGDSLNDE